jgi:6-phosphofructokinase 1
VGKDRKFNGLQFGYEVRCQPPTAFDVILGSQLGVGAYRALAEKGLDGVMISVGSQLSLRYEPFEKLINMSTLRAYARPIDPEEDFHQLARYLEARAEEQP